MRLAGLLALIVTLLLPAAAAAQEDERVYPRCPQREGELPVNVRAGTTVQLSGDCDGELSGTITIATQPAYGTAAVKTLTVPERWGGTVSYDVIEYTPSAGRDARVADPFTYTIAGVTRTWTPYAVPAAFNSAPVCQVQATPDGTPGVLEIGETLFVSSYCQDAEQDPIGTPAWDAPAHGTLTQESPFPEQQRYAPAAGFDPGPGGADETLAMRAKDRPPAPAEPRMAEPTTKTIRLIRPDHDPVCENQEHTVPAGTPVLPLLLRCTDADAADDLLVSGDLFSIRGFPSDPGSPRGLVWAYMDLPLFPTTVIGRFSASDGRWEDGGFAYDDRADGTVTVRIVAPTIAPEMLVDARVAFRATRRDTARLSYAVRGRVRSASEADQPCRTARVTLEARRAGTRKVRGARGVRPDPVTCAFQTRLRVRPGARRGRLELTARLTAFTELKPAVARRTVRYTRRG